MAFTLQIGAVAFALGAAVVAYVVRRQEQRSWPAENAKAAAAVNAQRLAQQNAAAHHTTQNANGGSERARLRPF